jgi:hypothetical protein
VFVALRSAVHADIDRQIGWAKDQVKRQTRHTALTGILAGVAGLAALGAVIVGLIALHSWVAMQTGSFVAHGLIGGGLLLLALIFFALAFIRRRPRLAARPPLQIVRPAALLGTLGQGSYDRVAAGGQQGRRLADHRAVRRTL